jgi:inhibitor of KinA
VDLSASYSIFPLGDSAITIDLGNCIDEQLNSRALALHDWLQAHRFPGLLDIIVAYSSVSMYYDPVIVRSGSLNNSRGAYYGLEGLLVRAWEETEGGRARKVEDAGGGVGNGWSERQVRGHFFRIPVCYEGEYAPDMEGVAREKGLSRDEVIGLHSAVIYRIYMVGFLPGFPYMGRTDPRLEIGRKKQPAPVVAGGVGIAGIQTGIYSLASPGGWQIIGRTPMPLFNLLEDPPIRLQAGDRVQFYPVSKMEFDSWAPPDVPDSKPFK